MTEREDKIWVPGPRKSGHEQDITKLRQFAERNAFVKESNDLVDIVVRRHNFDAARSAMMTCWELFDEDSGELNKLHLALGLRNIRTSPKLVDTLQSLYIHDKKLTHLRQTENEEQNAHPERIILSDSERMRRKWYTKNRIRDVLTQLHELLPQQSFEDVAHDLHYLSSRTAIVHVLLSHFAEHFKNTHQMPSVPRTLLTLPQASGFENGDLDDTTENDKKLRAYGGYTGLIRKLQLGYRTVDELNKATNEGYIASLPKDEGLLRPTLTANISKMQAHISDQLETMRDRNVSLHLHDKDFGVARKSAYDYAKSDIPEALAILQDAESNITEHSQQNLMHIGRTGASSPQLRNRVIEVARTIADLGKRRVENWKIGKNPDREEVKSFQNYQYGVRLQKDQIYIDEKRGVQEHTYYNTLSEMKSASLETYHFFMESTYHVAKGVNAPPSVVAGMLKWLTGTGRKNGDTHPQWTIANETYTDTADPFEVESVQRMGPFYITPAINNGNSGVWNFHLYTRTEFEKARSVGKDYRVALGIKRESEVTFTTPADFRNGIATMGEYLKRYNLTNDLELTPHTIQQYRGLIRKVVMNYMKDVGEMSYVQAQGPETQAFIDLKGETQKVQTAIDAVIEGAIEWLEHAKRKGYEV